MGQHKQDEYGRYSAHESQEQLAPPVERHMNGWEFLQWLIVALGEGIQWAWDEHPLLSLIFALLLVGLILVLTGHLDGAALWKWIAGSL